MPGGTCCRGKAVLITVYVERPRRRGRALHSEREALIYHHPRARHHYHYHRRDKTGAGVRYNRKEALLTYSQHLRQSARPPPPPSNDHDSKTRSSSKDQDPISYSLKNHISHIVPLLKRGRSSKTPTCSSNWKVLLPRFLRPFGKKGRKNDRRSKSTNKKAIISSVKKIGLVSKLVSSFWKRK